MDEAAGGVGRKRRGGFIGYFWLAGGRVRLNVTVCSERSSLLPSGQRLKSWVGGLSAIDGFAR